MAHILKEVVNNIAVCDCSKLTKEDIPGATLPKVPEKCKVSDLRVWLKCRRQKVKAKETKAELCLRVKKCCDSEEQFTFVDPYPSQPYLLKKQLQCADCSEHLSKTDKICTDAANECHVKELSWSRDATCLPKSFSYISILDYSKLSGKETKEHVEKPMNRGYTLFYDGYIHDIYTSSTSSNIHVKCRCFRSMRKHEVPHKVQVCVDHAGKVCYAKCTCVAGISGFCNHVFALLYQIDHSLKFKVVEFGRKKTCTELPSQWNKSRTDGVRAEPVMAVRVVKPRYGSESIGIKSSLYDASSGEATKGTDITETVSNLRKINPLIGLCQTGNASAVSTVTTSLDFSAPVGSALSYQLALTEGDFSGEDNTGSKPDVIIRSDTCEIPCFPWKSYGTETVEESVLEELKLTITAEEAVELEKKTREQSRCEEWFTARQHRLTASRFGGILKRKKDKETYVREYLLNKKNLSHVADRITYSEDVGFGLMEVKCSYSRKNISPKDSCQDKGFYLCHEGWEIFIKERTRVLRSDPRATWCFWGDLL